MGQPVNNASTQARRRAVYAQRVQEQLNTPTHGNADTEAVVPAPVPKKRGRPKKEK